MFGNWGTRCPRWTIEDEMGVGQGMSLIPGLNDMVSMSTDNH